METNNIINIPEGFEIDKEQSTERKIVLKKIKRQIVSKKIERPRTWEEDCEKMKGKDSYFFNETLQEVRCSNFGETGVFLSEFVDDEDVVAFVAFSRLRKLRRDWIGKNWKPDWKNDNVAKFTIISAENEISKGEHYKVGSSMSFPTEEMRDEFLDCFKDLLEQAKSLL